MEFSAAKIDLHSINASTYFAKQRTSNILRRAEQIREDSERDKRLVDQECKACYYSGSMVGGQALSSRPCGICGTVMNFSSTCTDAICLDCARKHNLCKCCGGDIEMKQRESFDSKGGE
jgi:hypothetical protein